MMGSRTQLTRQTLQRVRGRWNQGMLGMGFTFFEWVLLINSVLRFEGGN